MADGTVKQMNPFTGTEVWTVPGRGNRPLGVPPTNPIPLVDDEIGRHCSFCEKRYLETPPEKARLVRRDGQWQEMLRVPAAELFNTVAEFRRVPNLFEILSYEYWHQNYGYELVPEVRVRKQRYLSAPEGHDHVVSVVKMKLRAGGASDADIAKMSDQQLIDAASGFFGGGHDVIVARRHYLDGATDDSQLASSGTLTPEEHFYYIKFTVDGIKRHFDLNRYARYVVAFQNWMRPAGASFDHLHKQIVAIDERGVRHERTLKTMRENPNIFNEAGVNCAAQHNLVIAENEHAVAFAGFGHRFPTIEVNSKSEISNPWDQSPEELGAMADLLHAMHAATGTEVPSNEEWHYRPIDVPNPMPWRIMLRWRISNLAGFEGGTQVYLNTISPTGLRNIVVPRLFALRDEGRIGSMQIGSECRTVPNALRYSR